MGFWKKRPEDPQSGEPSDLTGPPLAGPRFPEPMPIGEMDVAGIAELFLRSYLLLTRQARGSIEQAQAFDDWMESHRAEAADVIARAASYPGCPEAEVAIPGGNVLWWQVPDPAIRFLCCYCGISGYKFPHDAAPVPNIKDFDPPAVPLARVVVKPGKPSAADARAASDRVGTGTQDGLASIRERLENENIMERLRVVEGFEKMGTLAALPGLREALANDHIAVRIQSAYALGVITTEMVPALVERFSGENRERQADALRRLDGLGLLQAAAIPELVEVILTDQHMAALAIAVAALGMIGTKAAGAPLIAVNILRNGGDGEDQSAEIAAIDRLNATGIAALLGLKEALKCPIESIAADAARGLEVAGVFEEHLLNLTRILIPKRGRSSEEESSNSPDPDEIATAVEKLSSDASPELRGTMALWLAMREPAGVAPHVRRIAASLADKAWEVRRDVALALGSLGRFAALAVPALRLALADVQPEVRRNVIMALGCIGPAAGLAVPELCECLHDSDQEIRETALLAISKIGSTFQPDRDAG